MPSVRMDFKHVRAQASFHKVAAHYNMTLLGKGEQFASLCTFHTETTPSLKINTKKNIFNCFGCGAHGNILDFVVLMEGGDPENARDLRSGASLLAQVSDVALSPAPTARAKGQTGEREAPREEKPQEIEPPKPRGNKPLSFQLKLDTKHSYLAERHLSQESIETFGLGVCDRGLMQGRLAIPIHEGTGVLIAYAGRFAHDPVPNGTKKYLLPEGFEKQLVLFNLHRLPSNASVVVMVESFFSVFRLHERGIPTISPMGHIVSEEHCRLLKERGIEGVLVLFDGDEAGASGIAHSVPLLARHFYVHAPAVPSGFKPHTTSEIDLRAVLHLK